MQAFNATWMPQFASRKAPMTLDLANRGLGLLYRPGIANFCPGCGRTHWFVGRFSAECGFCGTALPLVQASGAGSSTHSQKSRTQGPFVWAA
jgi:hypothetical protein